VEVKPVFEEALGEIYYLAVLLQGIQAQNLAAIDTIMKLPWRTRRMQN
jgi:hypothetical protein